MKTATATQVKNSLGEYLDAALREPVVITKSGRSHSVLLSWEDYQRLAAMEDAWWGEQALAVERAGDILGAAESLDFLNAGLKKAAAGDG